MSDLNRDLVLNALVVLGVVTAVGAVGYAVIVPADDDGHSAIYLLTEQDGQLVAEGYPSEFVVGESKSVIVGVENSEGERMQYTVVVTLENASSSTVGEQPSGVNTLYQNRLSLDDSERHQEAVEIRPETTGRHQRLAFLLYTGEPPERPAASNAYEEAHLWVNVTTPN